MSPAYFGRLSSWTSVICPRTKELDKMVIEVLLDEAYCVPLLFTYAFAAYVLLLGFIKLIIILRDDWEDASIFVDKVNTPLISLRVHSGEIKVVL